MMNSVLEKVEVEEVRWYLLRNNGRRR